MKIHVRQENTAEGTPQSFVWLGGEDGETRETAYLLEGQVLEINVPGDLDYDFGPLTGPEGVGENAGTTAAGAVPGADVQTEIKVKNIPDGPAVFVHVIDAESGGSIAEGVLTAGEQVVLTPQPGRVVFGTVEELEAAVEGTPEEPQDSAAAGEAPGGQGGAQVPAGGEQPQSD